MAGSVKLLVVVALSALPCCIAMVSRATLVTRGTLQNDTITTWNDPEVENYTFEQFVQRYNRTYTPGSAEWANRSAIFDTRKLQLLETRAAIFREQGRLAWTAGITKFMDYTDAEYRRLFGYKRMHKGAQTLMGTQLYQHTSQERPSHRKKAVTEFMTFATESEHPLSHLVRDQGGCGSCWAEAATSVLEAAMEKNLTIMRHMNQALTSMGKHGALSTLSSQTMVSCTQNPRHCGGTGGCHGATAELGFELVQENGIPLAQHLPYSSLHGQTGACPSDIFTKSKLFISGYTVLPSNRFEPLKQALVDHGSAIVISVDATNWNFYIYGIYSDTADGNKGDFQVNHAVSLMGWHAPPQGYWLIKNSWGSEWGENGFIRIEMKENEQDHCGWDRNTHEGLACDGDADTAWVCGTCGILFDSSYPYGLYVKESNMSNI